VVEVRYEEVYIVIRGDVITKCCVTEGVEKISAQMLIANMLRNILRVVGRKLVDEEERGEVSRVDQHVLEGGSLSTSPLGTAAHSKQEGYWGIAMETTLLIKPRCDCNVRR
jgi:hypothetical protein